MAKHIVRIRPAGFTKDKKGSCLTTTATILIFCATWTLIDPWSNFSSFRYKPNQCVNMRQEDRDATFYDDHKTRYTIDTPMTNWDEKRKEWLKHHETFALGAENRLLLVTGSQPSSCKNPLGDHFLLRFFKNKVDYCRIHGCKIFYNNAFLDSKMRSFWAKISVIRAAMVAHPDTEWILWVDSDAIFTNMDFEIPFGKYKAHNFVVHGWPDMVYEKKSWVAINAGIFLIRNCQWSMDFLDVWANMGPKSPDYEKWGEILKSTLKDKAYPGSDDQSALVYLLLKEKKKWGDKIYIENEYTLHGYWLSIVERFENITKKYVESYASVRWGYTGEGPRPYVTHFTGCQPCSGDHNPAYVGDSCWVGMERALNFADNQVLRSYGYMHPDLGNGSYVEPVPFD